MGGRPSGWLCGRSGGIIASLNHNEFIVYQIEFHIFLLLNYVGGRESFREERQKQRHGVRERRGMLAGERRGHGREFTIL
jgi:hypothetical protein